MREFRARVNACADDRLEPDDLRAAAAHRRAAAASRDIDRRRRRRPRRAGAVRPGQSAAGLPGAARRDCRRPARAQGSAPQDDVKQDGRVFRAIAWRAAERAAFLDRAPAGARPRLLARPQRVPGRDLRRTDVADFKLDLERAAAGRRGRVRDVTICERGRSRCQPGRSGLAEQRAMAACDAAGSRRHNTVMRWRRILRPALGLFALAFAIGRRVDPERKPAPGSAVEPHRQDAVVESTKGQSLRQGRRPGRPDRLRQALHLPDRAGRASWGRASA